MFLSRCTSNVEFATAKEVIWARERILIPITDKLLPKEQEADPTFNPIGEATEAATAGANIKQSEEIKDVEYIKARPY